MYGCVIAPSRPPCRYPREELRQRAQDLSRVSAYHMHVAPVEQLGWDEDVPGQVAAAAGQGAGHGLDVLLGLGMGGRGPGPGDSGREGGGGEQADGPGWQGQGPQQQGTGGALPGPEMEQQQQQQTGQAHEQGQANHQHQLEQQAQQHFPPEELQPMQVDHAPQQPLQQLMQQPGTVHQPPGNAYPQQSLQVPQGQPQTYQAASGPPYPGHMQAQGPDQQLQQQPNDAGIPYVQFAPPSYPGMSYQGQEGLPVGDPAYQQQAQTAQLQPQYHSMYTHQQ